MRQVEIAKQPSIKGPDGPSSRQTRMCSIADARTTKRLNMTRPSADEVVKKSRSDRTEVNPLVAKRALYVVHTILSFAVIGWLYSHGEIAVGFALFATAVLWLYVRGVLWVNIAMQALLVLIGMFSPFIVFGRHMYTANPDYSGAWVYFALLEIACFGTVFLLKKSKPAFERFLI